MDKETKALLCRKAAILPGLAAILAAGLIGSAAASPAPPEDGRLQIVATTTMLGDLTREIAGDAAAVTVLMGPGVDPHQYQAGAGDVVRMEQADVVVYQGLHLEGEMGDLFAGLSARGKAVVCAADGIDPARLLAGEDGAWDPHVWFDVPLWAEAAEHLAARLEEIDPAHAPEYRQNARDYGRELERLDADLKRLAASLPQERRVLITSHDAFRYFGRAYGFEVRGLQGLNPNTEAGTAGVRELADLIAGRQIRAVFAEASVSARPMEALREAAAARGCPVELGGSLYSDSLGDAAFGTESYCAACRYNMQTIVRALRGEGDG